MEVAAAAAAAWLRSSVPMNSGWDSGVSPPLFLNFAVLGRGPRGGKRDGMNRGDLEASRGMI